MELLVILLLLLVLSPAASSPSSSYKYQCDWCPRHSTASLFPPPTSSDTTTDATCGAATDMMMMELPADGFHLAAATADFFRDDGAGGCGACYQLRCRDQMLCANEEGVKVVVVMEKTATGSSGFLLTRDTFTAMMMGISSSSDQQLAGLSNSNLLQVDFRRIPCEYKKNLTVRVEYEGSGKPRSNLAVRFLYQNGMTDIAAVEVAQQQQGGSSSSTLSSSSSWRSMSLRRNKQGVWHTSRAPAGPLQLRLVVTAGSGGKWLRTALPADWRPGGVYDTGIQVTDVAVRACSPTGVEDEELR